MLTPSSSTSRTASPRREGGCARGTRRAALVASSQAGLRAGQRGRRGRPGGGLGAAAQRDRCAEGRAAGGRSGDASCPVHCLIESAAGLEAAYAIASTAGVAGISLGESDLRSETGALEAGLDWARGRIVNAAVAAGLPRPPQSVYPHVRDEEGLARSCARGRELGHLGRAAIHPAQLPVIEQAYLPTDEEVERAGATIERLEAAGAGTLGGGEFVDAAMLGAARQIAALAAAYGTTTRPPQGRDS